MVVLHGGPGAAHNYLDAYKLFAKQGRAVVHYDQLGCGNSTLLPDKGGDFWTPQFFVDELENLIDHLGQAPLSRARPIMGRHARGRVRRHRPKGLKSLTIANSPASMELWVKRGQPAAQRVAEETQRRA